jgi:hypothetical protein
MNRTVERGIIEGSRVSPGRISPEARRERLQPSFAPSGTGLSGTARTTAPSSR